ncbi:MAG TPA: hypothetical protein PLI09_06150 [Candidatus Hydrogenedentes bacterium]|nr:hypothetical protein [Candidatus Hydrogenedentota bacterium]
MGVQVSTIAPDLMMFRAGSVKLPRRSQENLPDLGFQKKAEVDLQVGFGKNTISAPTAALRTIDTSVQRARDIVPTVEEVQKAFREYQEQLERAQQEQKERFTPRFLEPAPADTTRQTLQTGVQTAPQTMASKTQAANPFAKDAQTVKAAYPGSAMITTPQLNILI